jgi:hypothetical protein
VVIGGRNDEKPSKLSPVQVGPSWRRGVPGAVLADYLPTQLSADEIRRS